MRIEVYLDGASEPFQVLEPPESFKLDTTGLDDGPHHLIFRAIDDDGTTSVQETRFTVRNGPGIAVHGIRDDDVVAGEVSVLANAYSSKVGDVFEPMRIETPAPIPTWAWLIFLGVFAWGMGYLGITYTEYRSQTLAGDLSVVAVVEASSAATETAGAWEVLGEQVYGNTCSACHQTNGEGLQGLFPKLTGNAVVTAADPSEQILTVLNGLEGKVIDGTRYPAPMPPFGGILTDEEISAVVNHERTSWGHSAQLVTAKDVEALRQ